MSSSGRVSIGAFCENGNCLIVGTESVISYSSKVESMLDLELVVSDADDLMVEGRDEREELELMDRRKMPIIAD